MLSGTIDEVYEVDRAIDRATIATDAAEAKIGSLEGELERVRAARRDAHLAANLALHRLAEIDTELRVLNVLAIVAAASA
jgi:hypothetical protein